MKTSTAAIVNKKKYLTYKVISIALWMSVAIFTLVTGLVKASGADLPGSEYVELTDSFKSTIVGFGITMVIALFIALFISNKLRTTVWMLSVIICTLVYGKVAMIIIFLSWFADEYIFFALAKKYKNKWEINKEIDLRFE